MSQGVFPNYIGGELVGSDDLVDVINPATGELAGQIANVSADQIDAALAAADKAFPTWSTTPLSERADWMDKLRAAIAENRESLTNLVHLEMGKPWAAATEDYEMLLHSLEFYAKQARELESEELADPDGTHTHEIVREPIGVVGAFLAWNFPLLNLAYKIGPSLASGCPIIVKPSAKTPLSALRVGQICHEIGLPAGVINIVAGSDYAMSDRIAASPIPAMLTLIGSTPVGQHIIKTGATSIKRYSMELGGNAPVLVFEDADLELAADVITALKFGNTGQICVAPNRVFAVDAVAKELEAKILERAANVEVGFGRESNATMGPLIDVRSRERMNKLVDSATSAGASLLLGGDVPAGKEGGAFFQPTVLSGVKNDMEIAQDEIFGPIVSLMEPLPDEDALIAAANDTEAGLTSYVFTKDMERARRCAAKLRFGEVQINGVKYAINLPHGGMKQSGIGVDCSHFALDDYFAIKRISTAIA